MGLEGVELVMAVEEHFGIELDEEACICQTPRELINVIMRRVRVRTGPSICLTQRAFYRVRRVLMGVTSSTRAAIRPETRLASLFPKPQRRATWRALGEQLGLDRVPGLVATKTTHAAALVCALAAGGCCVWRGWTWLIGLPAFLTVYGSGHTLASRYGTRFGAQCGAVQDLARYAMIHQPKRERTWTRREIAMVVRELIAEQTGQRHFAETADLVRDLGMD